MPMAKIFNTIDGGMQNFFKDKILSEIDPSLPNIKVITKTIACTSEAIEFKDLNAQVYVHGKTDGVGKDLDNEGYVIIDYKTSQPKPEHLLIYAAQLHSYAFGFSKHAENANSYNPVTRLGLIVYEPKTFNVDGLDASLDGSITWTEIPLDKKWFKNMLREVTELLTQTEPPEASEKCPYCKYVQNVNDFNESQTQEIEETV
jgi:CRISPR/Cas system-associated exonuclease Cas4 (RecB family)